MKQIYPDLWQTTMRTSGVVSTHAYLLTHPDGNILFYNTDDPESLNKIEELGGISLQLLTHRDEAGHSLGPIKERFEPTLMFTEFEAAAIAKYAAADEFIQPGDHKIRDIEVLETPGHTGGSVSFLYQSPHGKSYLFTGDAFFQWDGRWRTLILTSFGGDPDDMAASLKKIRDLNPDVVMSSGFINFDGMAEVTEAEWQAAIDAELPAIDR